MAMARSDRPYHYNRNEKHNHAHQSHHKEDVFAGFGLQSGLLLFGFRLLAHDTPVGLFG
jgi:hypothetical protein